jgi:hypothetical protein
MITQHINRLDLPPAASMWLADVWDAFQLLDDVADKDPIDRETLDVGIYVLLVRLPSNPFYIAHAAELATMLSSAVLSWKASDDAERSGKADARSYMWRAKYYDIMLEVVRICHGPAVALKCAQDILSAYGETYADYCEEFKICPTP